MEVARRLTAHTTLLKAAAIRTAPHAKGTKDRRDQEMASDRARNIPMGRLAAWRCVSGGHARGEPRAGLRLVLGSGGSAEWLEPVGRKQRRGPAGVIRDDP